MDEQYKNEEWKAFSLDGMDPNELYNVSSYGRVKHYHKKREEWIFLKAINQFKDQSGFDYVNNFKRIAGTSKRITESVHRLVAKVFIDKPNVESKYVIHVDFNKRNNHFANLKWVTQTELNQHNSNNPKVQQARSNRKGNVTHAKLTVTDVVSLKKKVAKGGVPLYKIAKEFGITHTQLNRIRKGENWAHVKIEDNN